MQDSVAERAFYDELFRRKPDNEHITEGYDEIHSWAFSENPEGIVLHVGCGTGGHAIRLAHRGYDVVAIDLTLTGVRAARDRFVNQGLKGRFVVADAELLPFKDGAAAVTWAALLLHHFPKLDRLPQEIARVTRDRCIALEPNAQNLLTWLAFNVVNRIWGIKAMTKNQRALWPKRLRRLFRAHGFPQCQVHYVDRGWTDSFRGVRSIYAAITRPLPVRFRANKFLVSFRKPSHSES